MSAFIFRPSRMRNGKRIRQKRYVAHIKMPWEVKAQRIPLGMSDKQAAQAALDELVREREREKSNLLPPKAERVAAARKLTDHLKLFVAEKEEASTVPRYVRELELRLQRLFREAGWIYAKDISAESFCRWRQASTQLSAKTLNDFRIAARSFTKWLRVSARALLHDPLEGVRALRAAEPTFTRRVITDEELHRLICVSDRRRPFYLTAFYTALRRNELRQLEWPDVKLDDPEPHIELRRSTTKNRRGGRIPLARPLVNELAALKALGSGRGRVFEGIIPKPKTFRKDLLAAGIERQIGLARVDFHAFRKTVGTLLASIPEVSFCTASKLLRHADTRTTAKHYVDGEKLPLRRAVDALPDLTVVPAHYASPDAQDLGGTCQNAAEGVATHDVAVTSQTIESQADWREAADNGGICREEESGARYRVRTCDPYRVKVVLYH
jgi:integrase